MWKAIAGFEGLYDVSDAGEVRNARTGYVLKPRRYRNGYVGVSLGRNTNFLTHRLVAIAFIPGDHGLQVNHKDGVRNNNAVQNLEWMTCSDNHKHSYRELERKQHAKQTRVVLVKGDKVHTFNSGVEAAGFLGVVPGSVSSANKKGHRCKGYEVNYV